MGAGRLARDSEKTFNGAYSEMRRLDKMIWYGHRDNLEDIRESIGIIKKTLDATFDFVCAEMKEEL